MPTYVIPVSPEARAAVVRRVLFETPGNRIELAPDQRRALARRRAIDAAIRAAGLAAGQKP